MEEKFFASDKKDILGSNFELILVFIETFIFHHQNKIRVGYFCKIHGKKYFEEEN